MTNMHTAAYFSVRDSHLFNKPRNNGRFISTGSGHSDNLNQDISFSPLTLSSSISRSASQLDIRPHSKHNESQVKRAKYDLPKTQSDGTTTPQSENYEIEEATQCMRELKHFLLAAPVHFSEDDIIRQFRLPNDEQISCVRWKGVFCVTGTDIVRSMVHRFTVIGRDVTNRKKFEEGIFSDLRNLKINVDATLESPKSELLEFLYKRHCVRTKKKQKVFFWYSVHHDQLFIDALERELKKEAATNATEKLKNSGSRSQSETNESHRSLSPDLSISSLSAASTVAAREPSLSFKYESSIPLVEQLPQILENLPPKYAELIRETTSGGTSSYVHPISHPFPAYNHPGHVDSLSAQALAPQGSRREFPSHFDDSHEHGIIHSHGYHNDTQHADYELSHSVSRNSFSQSGTPVSLETTPPFPSNASSSSIDYPVTPLQSTRKLSGSVGYASPSDENSLGNGQLCTPQSVALHPQVSHNEHGNYFKPFSQEALWHDTYAKQKPVPKAAAEANYERKLAMGFEPTSYGPNRGGTDFPLDVLAKEDNHRPFFSESSSSFKDKYTNFAHHHRPALSFSSLWGTNYFDDTPTSMPPQFQTDFKSPVARGNRSYRDMGDYNHSGMPPPQSPDWNQFLTLEDWSQHEPMRMESASAPHLLHYQRHHPQHQSQYSRYTQQLGRNRSPVGRYQLGSPLSFSNSAEVEFSNQNSSPEVARRYSDEISKPFARPKKSTRTNNLETPQGTPRF